MKKIATVLGTRPQFIKAAALSGELRKSFDEVIIHTGQHYDENMSPIFFKELSIPNPDFNLGVGSGSHGEQTGKMLIGIAEKLSEVKPDLVLVYGDTNSTLAGSIAAAKLNIPIAHVEAGLRSYNRKMPEEINRVVTDELSTLLFCPTKTAVDNLKKEGITKGVFFTGDVMHDQILSNLEKTKESKILEELLLKPKSYLYATIHRPENTDVPENLRGIFTALEEAGESIVLPLHPRTKAALTRVNLRPTANIRIIEPVGYLDNLFLEANAKKILTDSGGIQKEAYFLKIPCITLRNETEWPETTKSGWNILVGADKEKIKKAIKTFAPSGIQKNYFGDGKASKEIVDLINTFLKEEKE
ncbi:MAG TPA: UDP-N-acetylglucosamine 2-epimerase (non-hydrolyzing) [Candidatus Nanoarchaeia archaeon]|nr:UDP-2,3-diacetamido-2,3-dideoxy-D-glucuronate 2-epimerase [uncultured archaeon]